MDVSELELQELYTWVDEIPLSRPKRNIARDFSDGVLLAEIVQHFFPKLVEIHNYSPANASTQKMYNWNTLNHKVFKRLGFTLGKPEFEAVANCQPGAIERVLKLVRVRINKCREEGFTGAPPAPTLVPAAGAAAVITTRPPAHLDPHGGLQAVKEAPAAYMAHPIQAMHQPVSRAMPAMGHLGHVMPPMGPAKGAAGPPAAGNKVAGGGSLPVELLADREQIIVELRETNEILETKVRKLEQLVRLKDAKISTLMAKLQSANLA